MKQIGINLSALILTCASAPSQAIEVYGQTGFPVLSIGVAEQVSPSMTVRADYSTIGSISEQQRENGVDYSIDGRLSRTGIFADWFALGGGFRLTGGLTFNQAHLNLIASPSGGNWNIGNQSFPAQADDRFSVRIEMPKTMPYIGVGYGHHGLEPGWRFIADFGVAIGRASLTANVAGQLATQPNIQQEIERELAELRDGVGKIRLLPQLTIGVGYRF